MPVIRINANGSDLGLHDSPQPALSLLRSVARGPGPVVVMTHGYRFRPGHPVHCPHRDILSADPGRGWPHRLGFSGGNPEEGLAIAFGWNTRASPALAHRRAVAAGQALARLIAALNRMTSGRGVHVIAHSMGSEPALEALHRLPAGAVGRIVLLTGASYASRAAAALQTPAGRGAEVFNITSRENDAFDFLFERLIAPPQRGDRAIGLGLEAPNAVTLQLDCADTLTHLARLGVRIGPPRRRVCHWSAYTRPGALDFYRCLLRDPERLSLAAIRSGLPARPAPRWSRLLAPPPIALPLPFAQNAS